MNVALKCGRPVSNLVTIDPVGGENSDGITTPNMKEVHPDQIGLSNILKSKLPQLKRTLRNWIDIDATSSNKDPNLSLASDASDQIAAVGGDWGNIPSKYANKFIVAQSTHHSEFRKMMDSEPDIVNLFRN